MTTAGELVNSHAFLSTLLCSHESSPFFFFATKNERSNCRSRLSATLCDIGHLYKELHYYYYYIIIIIKLSCPPHTHYLAPPPHTHTYTPEPREDLVKKIHAQRVAQKKVPAYGKKKYSCRGNVNEKNACSSKIPPPPPP